MDIQNIPTPPTPWAKTMVKPTVAPSTYIHPLTNVIGDVRTGKQVHIAPGVSIRADEGMPFYIGNNVNVQDGVVIHGLEQGRVTGDDGEAYSVWIGEDSSITHMALIHGPAYVGKNCFIGFRSTVFNARVGDGCIVMSHALVENVELPPKRYVASGSVIIHQAQADRLPDVQNQDSQFASHVVSINQKLRQGYLCAEDGACIAAIRNEPMDSMGTNGANRNGVSQATNESPSAGHLSTDAIAWVQAVIQQGHHIGVEYADERRFRSNAWTDGIPIRTENVSDAIATLSRIAMEHANIHIRLFSIHPQTRQRAIAITLQ